MNELKLSEFTTRIKELENRLQKLEINHQPIKGDTIEATQDRLYFPIYAESPSILTTDSFTGVLGAIIYDTTSQKNASPAVQFYLDPDYVMTECFVVSEFFAGLQDTGSAYVDTFPNNIKLKLNPTRTKITGTYPFAFPYYRLNGGTNLATYTPTTDGETHVYNLTSAQISSLSSGKNSIALQSDHDSATTYCYGKLYFIAYGYIQKG